MNGPNNNLSTSWDNKTDRIVWAYVDKHSIVPGQNFKLMLSAGSDLSDVRGVIEIFRIGYFNGSDRKLVWRSNLIDVPRQRVLYSAASTGLDWSPTLFETATQNWQSGYYEMDFVTEEGKRQERISFIIVTNPLFSGDILVKLSTNTYQAYNDWGGHCLYPTRSDGLCYERGAIVSFDRPTQSEFYKWEYYFVIWLENIAQELNLKVDYATNFDVHIDPRFTENYKILISAGHDEYWTKEEFDNVYHRIFKLGKNTIFFGANTAYWQIRYSDVNNHNGSEPRGRQLICYKSPDDPIRYSMIEDPIQFLTTRFRYNSRLPETMLMGVGFQNFFRFRKKTRYAYYVENTTLPFFEGTGYRIGDFVGHIVGPEWDNTDPEGNGKRLWNPKKSLIPQIPLDNINIIFSGEPIDHKGRKGRAEAVFFVSDAGAKVFSSGTLRWNWGLAKQGFEQEAFKKLNRNLITYFLIGN